MSGRANSCWIVGDFARPTLAKRTYVRYTQTVLSRLPQHLRNCTQLAATRGGLVAEMKLISNAQAALDAHRMRVTAAINALGDNGVDAAEVLRSVGNLRSRTSLRMSATASRIGVLPASIEALAAGAITSGHTDVLADASRRVDPHLVDTDLLGLALSGPADHFVRRAREWVAAHESDADTSVRLSRQRSRRSVKSWVDDAGMQVWLAKLDPETAASVSAGLQAEYERLWRLDGGRNLNPADPKARTSEQRMADAFANLITRQADESNEPGKAPTSSPHVRQQMLAIVDLSRMRDDDPYGVAVLKNGTALPQAVLKRLACISDITGVVFDGPGQPLWTGRTHRSATNAQWKALIARDRGCVGCGADPNRCEAHHIRPWNRGGRTDITNMVLVCSRCHHNIHDRGMELALSSRGWVIRPRAGPSPREAAA